MAREIGAVLFYRGRGNDGGALHGQRGQERKQRFRKDELHLMGIDLLHFPQTSEYLGKKREIAAAVGVGRVHLPKKSENHRVGVKNGAVMKADAAAQIEGPGPAVPAGFPADGQRRFDLHGFRVQSHQGVENVADIERRSVVPGLGGIDRARFQQASRAYHDVARHLRGQDQEKQGQGGQALHLYFHYFDSFVTSRNRTCPRGVKATPLTLLRQASVSIRWKSGIQGTSFLRIPRASR